MDIVQNSLLALFLQAIPEMIAFSLLVVAISKDLKGWKRAVFVGIVLALVLHIIRLFPIIDFGIHTLIVMGMAVILYNAVLKSELTLIIIAVMVGSSLIFIGEMLSFWIITNFVGLTMEYVASSTFWWIVSGWPHIIMTLIIACVIYKRNKKDIDGGMSYVK